MLPPSSSQPATVSHIVGLDLPLILVLPSELGSQPVEQWQTLITEACQPHFSVTNLEWDWVNPELSAIPVDTFRELVGRLSFGVGPTTHRLVVVLAADLAPVQAQNALLKSLEEPPARTTIVLAVTNPASLLGTVLSRCQISYLKTSASVPTEPTILSLAADIETLLKFSQNPQSFSHSQLIQLSSQYKDRVSAQTLLRQWLEQLHQRSTDLTLSQLKLAQTTLIALTQLDQNLSPSLVLETLWFSIL